MVTTEALFEALDALTAQAMTAAEEYAESGDLVQLQKDLEAVTNRSFTISEAVNSLSTTLSQLSA